MMTPKICTVTLLFDHSRDWPHIEPFQVQSLLSRLRRDTDNGTVKWAVNGCSARLVTPASPNLPMLCLEWGSLGSDGAEAYLQFGAGEAAVAVKGDGVVTLARAVFGAEQLAPTLQAVSGLAKAWAQFLDDAGGG